jgi:hypothetical protein
MAMQRARRLASVAAVASLAVAGLSACRAEPSVAAYVGQSKLTEARIEAVWDEAHDKLEAALAAQPQQAGKPVTMPISRADVVRTVLSAQVLELVAKQQNLTLPADMPLNEIAASLHIPENTEYVRLVAQTDAYVRSLREGVKNPPPASDADLREVYDVLVSGGEVNASGSFAEFKNQLPEQNKQLVQNAAAVRKEIADVTAKMNIKVNPKYQPVGIPVLQFQTSQGEVRPLITAPLGTSASAPVTDLR